MEIAYLREEVKKRIHDKSIQNKKLHGEGRLKSSVLLVSQRKDKGRHSMKLEGGKSKPIKEDTVRVYTTHD